MSSSPASLPLPTPTLDDSPAVSSSPYSSSIPAAPLLSLPAAFPPLTHLLTVSLASPAVFSPLPSPPTAPQLSTRIRSTPLCCPTSSILLRSLLLLLLQFFGPFSLSPTTRLCSLLHTFPFQLIFLPFLNQLLTTKLVTIFVGYKPWILSLLPWIKITPGR